MKNVATFVCSLLAFLGVDSSAQPTVISPDTGQVFACTLRDGKTMDNVWSSLEALAQFPPSQDPEFSIFVWTQLRGAMPYDFVLGVNNGDMVKMAEGLTQVVAAPGWDAWAQRFESAADCISGIVKSEQIRAGTLALTAGRTPVALVETFLCSYKENTRPDALDSAVAYFKDNYESINTDAAKTYSAWVWRPYRGTSGTWDYAFVGAYPDFKTWAKGSMDYDATKAGQAMDSKFYAMSTCRTALWLGYWIVPPAASR